jgi:hypothetical protein
MKSPTQGGSMSNIPEGAQRSDDGQWWWDGSQWQPVEGAQGEGGQSPEGGQGEGGQGQREVTAEDLMVYNDTGPEPGDDSSCTEEHKEYFKGEVIPVDFSYAEASEAMSDWNPETTEGSA